MFNFEDLKDEVIKKENDYSLAEKGKYLLTLKNFEEKESSKGNPMVVLVYSFQDEKGKHRLLKDHIVKLSSMKWKIDNLLESFGRSDFIESKKIDFMELVDKKVWAKIDIQKGAEKDGGGFYPDKNYVKSYVSDTPRLTAEKEEDSFIEDQDIPF